MRVVWDVRVKLIAVGGVGIANGNPSVLFLQHYTEVRDQLPASADVLPRKIHRYQLNIRLGEP